mmetsp:Transcript_22930/g.35326  ORF Transcript_22930/g.35326 Transcript_22930/m.35326 type:complete len:156 (+) Transcript_22930:3541-4008(+)
MKQCQSVATQQLALKYQNHTKSSKMMHLSLKKQHTHLTAVDNSLANDPMTFNPVRPTALFPARAPDLESPARHEQLIDAKKVETQKEVRKLAEDLKQSLLDLKVQKKVLRRDSIINNQYQRSIAENESKFKLFLKGMKGHKRQTQKTLHKHSQRD